MEEQKQSPFSSDERMLAALAHLFGIVVALIVWVTQKDKSPFVKFQAIQAIGFDLVWMVIGMLASFCYVGVMFAGMFLMIFGTASAPESFDPALVVLPAMFPLAIFCLIMPIGLLNLGLRLFAAISVFQGKDYRYPFIGKQVEKFLQS